MEPTHAGAPAEVGARHPGSAAMDRTVQRVPGIEHVLSIRADGRQSAGVLGRAAGRIESGRRAALTHPRAAMSEGAEDGRGLMASNLVGSRSCVVVRASWTPSPPPALPLK